MRMKIRSYLVMAIFLGGLGSLFNSALAATCENPSNPCQRCTCTPQYGKSGQFIGYSYSNCTAIPPGTGNCPIPPPPPPPTPTSSKSGLAPLKNADVNYTTQTTNSSSAANFNYNSFPRCPRDVSGFADNPDIRTTSLGVTTDTADINARLPTKTTDPYASANATPVGLPDQCVVSSIIECGVAGQTCKDTSQPITKAIGAVCPDGYAQVAAFDMQPEVVFDSVGETYYPISNMADYQKYSTSTGYSCSTTTLGVSNTVVQNNTCSQASNVAGTAGSTADPGWNPWGYTFDTPMLITAIINGKTGQYVGYYDNQTAFGNCYYNDPPNCENLVGGTTGTGCPYPNNIYNRKWNVTLQFYTCRRNAGASYFSTNTAPRSLVCARIKSQYNKINK